jgi:hypothetical protein
VKQHNPFNKQWHTISYYNKSGNFLGPAIFKTEQEAEEYLDLYERKTLSHMVTVNNHTNQKQRHYQNKKNNKSTTNDNNNSIKRGRGKGRPSRNEHIKLKVFQESTLPPINKPSFFHRSN